MKKRTVLILTGLLICFCATLVQANPDPNDHPGMIAWYQFNEESGAGIIDIMHGNNAFFSGNVTREEGGVFGKCLRFVNNPIDNSYARMIDSAYVLGEISDELTIAFWMYGDDTTGVDNDASNQFASWQPGNIVMIHLGWRTSGIVFWNSLNATERAYFTPDPSLYRGSWRHWAFTRKSGVGGEMKIYVDGELVAGGQRDDLTPLDCSQVHDARFGASYNGLLDDYRIYARALSAEEIKSIYNEALECDPSITLLADLNDDCVVDHKDLLIMASEWLSLGLLN